MDSYDEKLKKFVVDLFAIDAIKFGEFKTKIGLLTPIYCDLRVIVSHPKLLETLAGLMVERIKNCNNFDILCGVPYTALPIATVISLKTGLPMVMRRREAKDHGTKKLIEGTFKQGDHCLVVEDVVTSGSSILETVKNLNEVGIKTTDAVVLLNREQGGADILREHGITMHALLTMTELMGHLKEADCVDQATVDKVSEYLKTSQVDSGALKSGPNRLKMPYSARIDLPKNQIACQLFKVMSEKQTNLCVAADLTKTTDILNLAEQIGPHICLLKTHVDIIEDFHPNFLKHLKDIATRHNFILLEDRKFADIGKTVELQFTKGTFQISSWAPLVTAHSLFGNGVLEALKLDKVQGGVFLLAEASAAGNLIEGSYTKATVKLALEYPDLIAGIVCQSPLFLENPELIQLTPGVQLGNAGDNLGQQYNSPESVVLDRGADIAVVGRGITQSPEPDVAAKKYKKVLWEAYLKRIV